MTDHAIVWRFPRQVLLEAARLGNVSEACRRAGVSRTTYYRWLRRYLAYGADGLAPKQGRPARGRARLSQQAEQAVLAYALAHPTHGPQRIADELAGERYGALAVSRMSVWRLLRRRGLGSRSRRLAALEGFALGEQGLLCEGRRRRLERHIEASRPGELLCLDSFYVGNLKGVGRIWQVTAIDAFSAVGWALLTVGELPAAVVRLLEGRVLPDCAAAGHVPERVLTDNGNEYRSRLLAVFLAGRGIAGAPHPCRAAAEQRLRRALPGHHLARVLPHRLPPGALRLAGHPASRSRRVRRGLQSPSRPPRLPHQRPAPHRALRDTNLQQLNWDWTL